MRDILTLFFLDVSFSLSFCSLFYVGLYLFGLEKCDVLVIICIILAVACMLAVIYLLNVMHLQSYSGRDNSECLLFLLLLLLQLCSQILPDHLDFCAAFLKIHLQPFFRPC